METINLTSREATIYVALFGAVIGFVLGLIPLLFGYFKGQLRLGILGIISSIIGGAILGVFLSVPAVIVFTWLILENRLVRTIIGASVSLVGIFLTAFGFIQMNSVASQVVDATGIKDPIGRALIICGLFYSVMGLVLFFSSIWPVFASKANVPVAAAEPDPECN